MIESYGFLKEFTRSFTSYGIILGVLFLIFNKYLLKLQELDFIHQIIKWVILFLAISYCLELSITFFSCTIQNETVFFNRVFGDYFWAYWFMMFFSTIFPLLLLNKKLGESLLFLVLVVIGLNIGRILEQFIIVYSNIYIDYFQ